VIDERTDLNQGKQPSSYQVTLDDLREGGGDTTLESQPTGDVQESSQPPPTRTLKPKPDDTPSA
jgi:hypothetical protein